MTVTVRLSARLARHGSGRGRETLELPAGATVASVLSRLGIRPADAPIVTVDNASARPETALADGSTVALFPPPASGG